MVVAEGPTEYILYTQNDHGDLAGQFAAHWGNETFSPLRPRGSMVLVAEAHDNGWWYWDVNPAVDDQGIPITFRKTPRNDLASFVTKGIESLLELDLYAGLIASMHHAGLPQQRYGTMEAVPQRHDEHTRKFLAEREPFNQELVERVGRMEQYAGANSRDYIWFNYRMMQVFDRMSLFFCCNYDLGNLAAPESGRLDDRESGRAFYGSVIKPTPVQFGVDDGELRLRVVEKNKLLIDPYPFDEAPLKVSVRGRVIPRRSYNGQEEFRDVYRSRRRETFEYALIPK
ncbi:MAG: DUF3891 family protein [Deltaproteobacteria bacterium]|nr:DUF3891 family protein [Deltaproteobacteria bacterium]